MLWTLSGENEYDDVCLQTRRNNYKEEEEEEEEEEAEEEEEEEEEEEAEAEAKENGGGDDEYNEQCNIDSNKMLLLVATGVAPVLDDDSWPRTT